MVARKREKTWLPNVSRYARFNGKRSHRAANKLGWSAASTFRRLPRRRFGNATVQRSTCF